MRLKIIILLLLISSAASSDDKAIVKRVSDGDTIIVMIKNRNVTVRLIGIDAPENKSNTKAKRNSDRYGDDLEKIISQGKKAKAFVKSILRKGDRVSLVYDSGRLDRYGRTLAYVYLSDGRMLNDIIISSGYAYPRTIPPNVKYKERFRKSYRKARESRIGLWADE